MATTRFPPRCGATCGGCPGGPTIVGCGCDGRCTGCPGCDGRLGCCGVTVRGTAIACDGRTGAAVMPGMVGAGTVTFREVTCTPVGPSGAGMGGGSARGCAVIRCGVPC